MDEYLKGNNMGMNVQSACHRCKEKVFHFRGRENESILPFYRAHRKCMDIHPDNVVTKDDQYQSEDWMDEDSDYSNFSMQGE